MDDGNKLLRNINDNINFLRPFIEWTHNYAKAQVVLLKKAELETKNVIEFWYQSAILVKFYVPKAHIDYIQGFHLLHEKFWDIDNLRVLEPFVRDKHILDIGANVGNHAVYWGLLGGAASIQAFEPMPETFIILEKNIKLNNLTRRVKIHRCALGDQSGTGDPTSTAENRMAAEVHARADSKGAIQIRTLDSFNFEIVDFIKIDVEGRTYEMLQGARETLKRCRPPIYVELFEHEANKCRALLESIDYELLGYIEETNYVFVHKTRSEEKAAFANLIGGGWPY